MIVKERKIPIHLMQLEALWRRLPENYLKREEIAEDIKRQKAGYKGERSVDYQLTFLKPEKYRVFHDVRLFDGTHYFQLDTLVLSSKFLLF
ncbi:nuclease-related domain-containing protein [Bacillus manliponensis]|uniref:nuclease-related domain-containing protein n=1 Tax=Bacillus manliponensis TaxID=574376 RepID=UPI003514604E